MSNGWNRDLLDAIDACIVSAGGTPGARVGNWNQDVLAALAELSTAIGSIGGGDVSAHEAAYAHYTEIVLGSDETNDTTTLGMSAALQFTPEAGCAYLVEYFLGYTAAATTTGLTHWLAPGNASDGGGWFASRGTAYTNQNVSAPSTLTGSFPVIGQSSGAGLSFAWGKGVIIAAGSSPTACGVEFASEVGGSMVTLKARRCVFRYRKIGSS